MASDAECDLPPPAAKRDPPASHPLPLAASAQIIWTELPAVLDMHRGERRELALCLLQQRQRQPGSRSLLLALLR